MDSLFSGESIQQRRLALGIDADQMADILKISPTLLARIENDEYPISHQGIGGDILIVLARREYDAEHGGG